MCLSATLLRWSRVFRSNVWQRRTKIQPAEQINEASKQSDDAMVKKLNRKKLLPRIQEGQAEGC